MLSNIVSIEVASVLAVSIIKSLSCYYTKIDYTRFVKSSILFIDVNECADPNACNAHEDCANTDGSYDCTCMNGYYNIDEGICQQDPCVDSPCGHGQCNTLVYPVNELYYNCSCFAGFTGDTCATGKS